MYLSSPIGRGTYQNSTTGTVTSQAVATTAAIAVGKVVVLRVATTYDGDLGASGATAHHLSVIDDAGNTWVKVGESSRITTQGDPTISIWIAKVEIEIPNAANITAAFDIGVKGRVLSVVEYSLEEPTATLEVIGAGVAHAQGTSMSVTATMSEEEEISWLLAGVHMGDLTDTVTLSGSFVTDQAKVGTTGAGFFRSTVLFGQYRQLQTDAQTWTGTLGTSLGHALVLGAIRIVPPPPPPPPPGTREFQPDFETDTAQVDRTSTTRRPDAVSWDFLTRCKPGPLVLDTPGTMYLRIWRLRVDANGDFWLARANVTNTAFEDEVLVTTYSEVEAVDEMDFTFTSDGTIVIVTESASEAGGNPGIHLYRYNPHPMVLAYQWDNKGPGRTPRCEVDFFPTTVGVHVCPPQIDVQVMFLKSGTGMVRLEQSDGYSTQQPTVLGSSALTRLHQLYRTTDRRMSVLYSQRNLATGRWQFRRVDSMPYRDSLLARPTFLNWSSPFHDIMQSGDDAWREEEEVTNDWNLRIETPDDVDAIEVVAASDYPAGAIPVFDQQAQEYAPGGGIAAGGYWDFVFSISHGLDTMSLVAWRARTRRTVGEVTCYSPWRYTIIPASAPAREFPSDTAVNCARDMIIDLPYRNVFLRHGIIEGTRETDGSARGDAWPTACTSGVPRDGTDVLPGGAFPGWWFVGGSRNIGPSFPFPTHFQRYEVRRRSFEDVNFSDEDGTYVGHVYGAVMESSAGSAPPEFDWPSTRFPRQFPDDTGMWPTPPGGGDVIAGS